MARQKKVFKGTLLPLETTLYVPSTSKSQKIIPAKEQAKRVQNARTRMSKLFGGYTSVKATGGWFQTKKGRLIKEPVFKITSFSKRADFKKAKPDFSKYVRNKAKEWGQDVLSVEYEGDLYWISPSKKRTVKKRSVRSRVKRKR